MNIGTVSRVALKAVSCESIDNKLLVSKKIIKDLEDNPNEASFRLCRDLRVVLKSVAKNSQAPLDQTIEACSLLLRVKKLDPRAQEKSEKSDRRYEESAKPKPSTPKVSDGFEPGFINSITAVARVVARYGGTRPRWTPFENEKLLQVALGDIALDEHSVVQLWLSLSYDFKNRLNCVESSMLPQSLWITAAICEFVNTRNIRVPTPNCFENVTEECAFRA